MYLLYLLYVNKNKNGLFERKKYEQANLLVFRLISLLC